MNRTAAARYLCLILLVVNLSACQLLGPAPHPRPADPANVRPAEVSLNGLDLPAPARQPYRFLVVGHLYGTTEGSDRQPDKALVASIPALKQMDLSMLVSLGDMVKASKKEDFTELNKQLISLLPFPMFNIPGNHDVEDRALYETLYGQTYYSFSYGTARMIFLDTELENCALDAAQAELLPRLIDSALQDPGTQNIFIFMHKTLFFQNQRLFELKSKNAGPNVWDCYNPHAFNELLDGTIMPAAKKKPIYLFAGDVGAWGNLTPYYARMKGRPLTMVMTGLGDTPQDSGILVTVNGADVKLEVYSLTGQPMPALETYNSDYWVKQAEKK